MKTWHSLLFLIPLGWASQASAAIRPSFSIDYCSWHATHILVATEGESIDGRFLVLESWKGNLSPGESISIPELASFKSLVTRAIKTSFGSKTDVSPKYVTGSKMILFLKKKSQPFFEEEEGSQLNTDSSLWSTALLWGTIKTSVVWIEGNQSYAFRQLINPGPSRLQSYGRSEEEIYDRVREVLSTQQGLKVARTKVDVAERAEALQPFTLSTLNEARDLAFVELQRCGKLALPVLRKMLSDQSMLPLHAKVVKALAKAGGPSVGPELTLLVVGEMDFWMKTAPRLEIGWWSGKGLAWAEVEVLRDHYSKVLEAIYMLREIRFAGCRNIVVAFRDYWRSLPQLEGDSGKSQLSEECDKLLRQLY